MKFHRPKSLVSPQEATQKLFHAVKRGNVNSAKRQFNRGANVTAKNTSLYRMGNNTNLFDIIYMKNNTNTTKKNLFNLIESKGYNVKKELAEREAVRQEGIRKMIEGQEAMKRSQEARNRERLRQARENQQRKKINQFQKKQENLRSIAMARKRLSNINAAMTYKNGKPQGLSIKTPKNKTRKVHFYNNTLPVK